MIAYVYRDDKRIALANDMWEFRRSLDRSDELIWVPNGQVINDPWEIRDFETDDLITASVFREFRR